MLSAKQPTLLLWRLVHYTVRVLQWNVQRWSTLTQVCDLERSYCRINQCRSLSLQRGFTNHLCVTWQVRFNAPLTSQLKGKKKIGYRNVRKAQRKDKEVSHNLQKLLMWRVTRGACDTTAFKGGLRSLLMSQSKIALRPSSPSTAHSIHPPTAKGIHEE